MRLNLRTKLLLFAIVIAIVPLLVAGRTMIRIAQDELKSSANEQLSVTARELAREIDDLFERSWLAPLQLIRNAIDDERLGVEEKISLLTRGIADIPDIVALQITVEGAALPLVVVKDDFAARLKVESLDPLEVLRVPASLVAAFGEAGRSGVQEVRQVPQSDDWLATVVLPLEIGFGAGRTWLSARINLDQLRRFINHHPFNRTGVVTIVDAAGQKVFASEPTDLSAYDLVTEATRLLAGGTQIITVEPYTRPDGEVMLGAFVFPQPFDWAILVEKRQRDAYLAVEKMLQSLGLWSLIGVAVAAAGALLLALRISRPIVKIERVTQEVAQGNFEARVEGVRSRDEVGDLARRMNEMIVGLNERFQLAKFVSAGTMAAIKTADLAGVRLGGQRQRATMLFCDIRGYTAFAERRDPETVIEVLNMYLHHQADIVSHHHGDVDKFVGDQIVAVFQGDGMERNAIACALEIQVATDELGREHPDRDLKVGIGINTGEVIVGAMGSKHRMDYTVLGDAVNLAARLCSNAAPGQTLISGTTHAAIQESPEFIVRVLSPIAVKGKSAPVPVYDVGPTTPITAPRQAHATTG
jgi:adenylate cyclase